MIQIVRGNRIENTVTTPDKQNLAKKKVKFYSREISKLIVYDQNSYTFESMPIILADGTVANLQITKSIQNGTNNLATLRYVLLAVTLIALVPVIVSSRILSKLITQPVLSIIRIMTDIRENGHFKRIPLEKHTKDELFQMAETFNHMIDLLESNFKKQAEFVSNASHELKTPLTIIESYASLVKRRGLRDPDILNESIEAIHSEAIRMKEMTEQLLLLAKNPVQWNVDIQTLNLGELLKQTIGSLNKAYNLTIDFEQESPHPLLIETDSSKLKQLLFIFLDNARKYGGQPIKVVSGTLAEKTFIRISDRGPGIPEKDLPKVFDRFYRVDRARSKKVGGFGLGLSLAKEIADAIRITITFESVEGEGTTVTLLI